MTGTPLFSTRAVLLRRGRGINGMAAAWTIFWVPLWTVLGLAFGAIDAIFAPHDDVPWYFLLVGAPFIGFVLGFVGGWLYGLAFGALVWGFERGRSLESLPAWRVVVWGALPGAVVAGALDGSFAAGLLGLLGAGTAFTMFRLVRRATTLTDGASGPVDQAT